MKLSLLIVAALSAVASGVTTAGFNATVVDSEGVTHSGSVSADTLVANPDGSATQVTTLTFADDIPAGSISGSVVTVDSTGAFMGSVTYSGSIAPAPPAPVPAPPAPNMQPVATTVTVQVG